MFLSQFASFDLSLCILTHEEANLIPVYVSDLIQS